MQKRYKGAFTDVFVEKYKVSPSELMESISTKHFGNVKRIGLDRLLIDELEKRNIEADGDFYKALIEAIADSNVKLPENQKLNVDFLTIEIPNIDASQPKSKGVLEDFKDIVSTDDLRPAMMGVYVSKEGYLVGTDAHILVKYKTNDFNEYEDKIIDLKKYIGTKGKAIDFIDAKYPNFDAVIPQDNEHKYKGLNTYAFYNFCKSAINVQKQTTIQNFSIALKMNNDVYSLSPILFSDLLNFALSKGFDSFELEVSDSKTRALVLRFENGSIGLIMPIMKMDDSQGSAPYTLEEVQEIFGKGKSATKTRTTTTTTRKEKSKSTEKTEAYRKFEGSIEDATYVPRREIRSVELINGEILSQNEIIDGIYRAKKKFEVGGVVERYDNPLFNQGMQGELSGFGTSSPMSVFANGGTTDPHKFSQDTLMSNGGKMSVIEQLLKKYNVPQSKVDETSEWLKKEWEGKNVDDYIMYSDKYGRGGKTASIGDSGIITDKHSMFLGKMALITGDLGNMYEVRVGDRTTIVKKNGINIISDEYAKGGVVGKFKEGDKVFGQFRYEYGEGLQPVSLHENAEKVYGIVSNIKNIEGTSMYTITFDNGEVLKYPDFAIGNFISKSRYSDGGETEDADMDVKFIEYKGNEIMYEPHYKKYYANDVEFDSLKDAQKFLDSGETSNDIRGAYQKGLFAKGGEVNQLPPKGEFTNSNNLLLKYEKVGNNYEFFVYEPISREVSGYKQTKFVCKNSDCPLKMNYQQFINYLYSELYLDDKKYAKGGEIGNKFRGIDLFEDYEMQEPKLRKIVKKINDAYEVDEINTKFLSERLKEAEAIGYTFEIDMDGSAYGLRPQGVEITELEGFEEYAKGGEVEITNETIDRGGLGSVQDSILAKGGLLKKAKSFSKKAIKKAKPIAKKIVRKSKKFGAKAVKSAKIGFDALAKKVAESYEGKKVNPKYQAKYGKTYSKEEAKEVGQKVSAKVYRQQLGKRKITRKLQNKTK